ncbi:hypothetical protein [Sphingomonas sp.]|uniref:hypothetical protein n=1 Tax=Sphingomonas sp. TaxID=28214 RepID=UPI002ED9B5EA
MILALGCAACGGDGAAETVRHDRARAARAGLYAIQAAPGGALARFADVRLFDSKAVCGKVDGQDGGGLRRFGVLPGREPVIEQPGDAATVVAVERICAGGKARAVVSRNAGYTDIRVEDHPG